MSTRVRISAAFLTLVVCALAVLTVATNVTVSFGPDLIGRELAAPSDLATAVLPDDGGRGGSGDDYPWKHLAKDSALDPWRMFVRNCTSFVAWALHSRNGFEMPFHADAKFWGPRAQERGFTVDTRPARGAVAWSDRGTWGHVAWIAEVLPDGRVRIEEYNYRGDGRWGERVVTAGEFRYIHFADIPAPAAAPTAPAAPAPSGPIAVAPPAPPAKIVVVKEPPASPAIQGSNGQPIQGSSAPVQGSSPPVQGSSEPVQGSNPDVQGDTGSRGEDDAQATTTTTTPPTTTTTAPPTTTTTAAPRPQRGFTIEDSYLHGTWARSDTSNGTWYSKANRPPNGRYWLDNGIGVAVDCARSGATYHVWINGQKQYWSWWARVTDGTWVPTATFREVWSDGNPGGLHGC